MTVAIALLLAGCATPPPEARLDGGISSPLHDFIPATTEEEASLVCGLEVLDASLTEMLERAPAPCSLGAGWSGSETWGTWAIGGESRLTIVTESAEWQRVAVRTQAYRHLPSDVVQSLEVAVNDVVIGRKSVPRMWRQLVFDLPRDTVSVGANEVVLRFAHSTSPRQAGVSSDHRQLAANVASVALLGAEPPTAERAVLRTQELFDSTREVFVIDRAGKLVVPMERPQGPGRIVLDLELSESMDRRASHVSADWTSLGGQSIRRDLPLWRWFGLDGRSQRHTINLPPDPSGAMGVLALEIEPHPSGSEVVLRFPRITSTTPTNPSKQHPVPNKRHPDIVLLTLDAARPDHFSHAGYHRQTTPRIDDFARTALVFDAAFALAPYTLCSVPTMITGLSFLDHGVVSRSDVLSPKAFTLAEGLKRHGYLTAAFSATPNNSAGRGFSQGYDEFHELWRDVPKETAQDPHYVAQRVIDWLDAQPASQPFHLQVHFIPPHAPYAPADRFDTFTDPGYAGPCDGETPTLEAIETGVVSPDEGCLEHVIGLYDGNLAAVDDAVGRVLDALRSRPRWGDTVVLITSDHGEAFLEHGRMTHNSTVYDEMLRVPFLLKVPEWLDASNVDTQQLVTLADITPTLLGAALGTHDGRWEGRDLLAPVGPRSGAARTEFFVAQNTDKPAVIGLRSPGWKAILQPNGTGALFGLTSDAAERNNLVLEEPALHRGLVRLLADRAVRPPAVGPSTDQADVTDEDRKMLEALGYVE